MKELKRSYDWNWDAWFWLDQEEFEDGWKIGQCRYRVEKAVGRDTAGKLFLMVWINHDRSDWHKFTQDFFEIDFSEYVALLDRAITQGKVKAEDRRRLIEKAKASSVPPWDSRKAVVVYRDGRFTLGQKDEKPYLIAAGKTYLLTCHPYEPCLYITDESGFKTAVHNAFDPFDVLDSFYAGRTVTSITGLEYDARDFCVMAEYAAGMGNIGIGDAERVFAGRVKEKSKKAHPEEDPVWVKENPKDTRPEASHILRDDPFYELIAGYPACVVDYCIIKDDLPHHGCESHRRALSFACRALLKGSGGEDGWHYNLSKASAKKIDARELFSLSYQDDRLNYRKAFLYPPHENEYSGKDFAKVNAVLFPNGTDGLEAYEWTTGWSDYFDEGHEWWGALCLTVYDKSLDRSVIILASATD
ncbi:MAG: hypothetical protein IJT76_04630 [Clostridia bacterium]|nr:hypothetical protein [Clostridia bacterium]